MSLADLHQHGRQPAVIAPSILSANFARLGDDIARVVAAGADWIHFDVMDNHYVPNLTFGPMICEALKPYAGTAMMDVHLMVEPVDALVPAFAKAGAGLISFHPEASRHVDRTLALIHDNGCQAGLVLNPATPLNWLDHVMDKLDLVMLMSVNPGFGGQSFIAATLPKLVALRQRLDAYAERSGRHIRLEVDGGVKPDNIAQIAAAGADTFVAGSAVFGSTDWAATIAALRSGADGADGAVPVPA
jgi:ribulose-phosphate 3-epimerase